MQHDDVQYERPMCCFYFMLRPKIDRNAILPLLELPVKLADGIQEGAIRLFGSCGRVEALVHLALNNRELAQGAKHVELPFPVE